MVDLVAFGVIVLVSAAVLVRRASAGVALLTLLAGALLDQLLGEWLIGLLPQTVIAGSDYIPIAVHLVVTFAPVLVAIGVVKVGRQSVVLSLLTSLLLGFLMVVFGLKILAPVKVVSDLTYTSGLLSFVRPYDNAILAAGAVLAIIEMIVSHRTMSDTKKKK